MEHGKFDYGGYTGVYNLLDYSAVSFPCGINVDSKVDVPYNEHRPLSETDAQVQSACEFSRPSNPTTEIITNDLSTDDARKVDGLPVSLQLVARRLEEEKLLMMTDVVLQSLQRSINSIGSASSKL